MKTCWKNHACFFDFALDVDIRERDEIILRERGNSYNMMQLKWMYVEGFNQ